MQEETFKGRQVLFGHASQEYEYHIKVIQEAIRDKAQENHRCNYDDSVLHLTSRRSVEKWVVHLSIVVKSQLFSAGVILRVSPTRHWTYCYEGHQP